VIARVIASPLAADYSIARHPCVLTQTVSRRTFRFDYVLDEYDVIDESRRVYVNLKVNLG